jgi:hypothetical protein
MRHHTTIDTFKEQFYQGTLETVILEVGVGSDIFQYPYEDLQHLATPSLVKTAWERLSEFNLLVKHDTTMARPQINDILLMQLFYNKGARGSLLLPF